MKVVVEEGGIGVNSVRLREAPLVKCLEVDCSAKYFRTDARTRLSGRAGWWEHRVHLVPGPNILSLVTTVISFRLHESWLVVASAGRYTCHIRCVKDPKVRGGSCGGGDRVSACTGITVDDVFPDRIDLDGQRDRRDPGITYIGEGVHVGEGKCRVGANVHGALCIVIVRMVAP